MSGALPEEGSPPPSSTPDIKPRLSGSPSRTSSPLRGIQPPSPPSRRFFFAHSGLQPGTISTWIAIYQRSVIESGRRTYVILPSPHLNDSLPCLNGRYQIGVNPIKSCQKRRITAISEPYPDQPTLIARTVGQEHKILIFADENSLIVDACVPSSRSFFRRGLYL